MAFEVFAVLSRPTSALGGGRGRRVTGPDEPYGYHASKPAAEASAKRWKARHPWRNWRVARLAEVKG